MPERSPGQFRLYLLKAKRGLTCRGTLRVTDFKALKRQRRTQANPVRVDLADSHRAVDFGADQLLDIAAIVFDLGQDRVTQCDQQYGESEIHRQQQPRTDPQYDADPWQSAGKGMPA